MKKAIAYEAPRAWDDEESTKLDAIVRAIELTMMTVGTAHVSDQKHEFADRMYDYILGKTPEELLSYVSDMEQLSKSSGFIAKACMQMMLAKVVHGDEDAPTAAEVRARMEERGT